MVPFPISSSDDEGTIRYKRVGPAVNIDLQKEGLPSATPSRFGLFRRRRSTNGSKAEVSTDDLASRAQKGSASKLKRPASQRRNSDPTMSITQEKNLQPRPSIDDALKADSPFVQKIAGGHLMPPLAARAHEGGTWGRSASSDVPRKEPGRFQINDPDLIFEDQKNSKNPPTGPRPSGGKRRGSFSKMRVELCVQSQCEMLTRDFTVWANCSQWQTPRTSIVGKPQLKLEHIHTLSQTTLSIMLVYIAEYRKDRSGCSRSPRKAE